MPRKVLIVEDNGMNRKVLANILHGEYDVLEAVNGEEALTVLHKKHRVISAVVLDIFMPVMDGFEVLKAMRCNAVLSQIPVIVATGSQDAETEVKALSLGANDFVTKPYNPALLLHCLRNTINLRETASIINAIQRDKLTGLYNREAFFEKAESMLMEREPGYYIMTCFDIDSFKVINDQYGAKEGDRILRHIGVVAKECFDSIGGISARIAADNFAALYPAGEKETDYVARMRDFEFTTPDTHATIVYSVGRYLVTDLSLSASAIYDRAYLAKQSVKGRYDIHIAYFSESMRDKLIEEQEIIGEMDAALALRQFEIWFQPQFNHATGALIGAEALVRWRHPQRGLVPPGVFIPVFEQNGFVYELDKYVWEQTCLFLRKWLDAGRSPLPVSVNVSRYDVFREDFFPFITGLMERYRIPIDLLRLEITESAFAQSAKQIIAIVKRLIDYGFTVEIDDFGSGYSSLNILKDVPASVLKLDMKFMESTGDSQRGGNIVESVVRMTKWIGMSVIAEGVETTEQADYLKSIGCSYIQGYLYARPMPADDYELLASKASKEERLLRLVTVENLDNNSFWDPESMDTLVFNSYVGGACIYEYHGGVVELLRLNDKYAGILEEIGVRREDALKLNWAEHLDDEGREALFAALERSIRTGEEVAGEYVFVDLPGALKETYLRSDLRVIASSGDHYLVYCISENITAQRQADEQLRFLNETAHDLLSQPDTGLGIQNTLKKLLYYFAGKRACVFEFDLEKQMFHNTYEVCAEGAASRRERLQNVPMQAIAAWLDAFQRQSYIHIADVKALDESREEERAILRTQGIDSIVAVPLERDGKQLGFIAIGGLQQQHPRIDRLVALGDYIAVMLTRRDLDAKIRNDNETLLSLMNDTPGGFVRMQVLPGGAIVPVYFNRGFYQLTGMDRDGLMELYGKDAMAGVHPEDIGIVLDAVRDMTAKGEAHSAPYRLRHGKGGYILVMIFGRMTRNESGETFLNVYYTEASGQSKLDEQRMELLDNLPCGAGICEISDGVARMTYFNKRYRRYIRRNPDGREERDVFAAVHPEDREKLKQAMQPAFTSGGEGRCDVRIRDGKGGYLAFHLVGSAMERTGGKTAIYVTFVPISREEQSYGEMLPVALSAVIGANEDLAYVKGRDFRYICCSPSFVQAAGCVLEKEIIGKTDYELVGRDYAEKYRWEDEKLIKNKHPLLHYEEVMPTKDGSLRYADTSKYPLLDGDGNVIGIYGVTRDVTSTREADSQLKLLNNSIPGGIATYVCSPEGMKLTYCNEGFRRLFGSDWVERERKDAAAAGTEEILPEDLEQYNEQLRRLILQGEPMNCVYRVHTPEGGRKWIDEKAVVADRNGDRVLVNALFLDITERQEAAEQMRIREEEHQLAIRHSGNIICRYNVAEHTASMPKESAEALGVTERVADIPWEPVRRGWVSPDTADAYTHFFQEIMEGKANAATTFRQQTKEGWRWLNARSSTIFSSDGRPVSAVISFYDVTEQLEKEAVYKKWQQSIQGKDPASYTLFRCNLSKDASFDTMEGSLLQIRFQGNESASFDERTMEYVNQCVWEEDRERYAGALRSDTLLAGYYRGKRSVTLEYREKQPMGAFRWLRLTIDLVEYPNSKDVEAYLLYENIDHQKRAELLTIQRAETDPLTGILNRATFASRVESLIQGTEPGRQHALLMLDIDGFKMVNDAFGHGVGDQALIDAAASLRSILRAGDLLGRLGGDEFMVFLRDIPGDTAAAGKAEQICALLRRAYSVEVQISASVGIVLCPRDGADFDTLYKKVDNALYYVKGSGKDSYAFYDPEMGDGHLSLEARAGEAEGDGEHNPMKRRMLIVDDSQIDHAMLSHIFQEDFIIEKARDGNAALVGLRRYGAAISVVLLDLMMPGMDGFAVLEKMQASRELSGIPVVVVSGDEGRETGLRAIRSGASDFVVKPVDPDVLRIRVSSAISKAENERLRAQNRYLELAREETAKYRTLLAHTGTVLIEHDFSKGAFRYDPEISSHIGGAWNQRPLWKILLADGTADEDTVERMRRLAESVARDPERTEGAMEARLKTPEGELHRFAVHIYRQMDTEQPAGKLIITLKDLDAPGLEEGQGPGAESAEKPAGNNGPEEKRERPA